MSSAGSPIRYPDTSSPKVMTTRAWWLVVLNVLFPGSAQLLAGNRRLGRFGVAATLIAWILVVLLLIIGTLWPTAMYTLGTFPVSLILGQIALFFYAILWLILTLDTLRLARIVKTGPSARFWVAGFAIVLLVLTSGTAAYSATLMGGLNGAISKIFVAGPSEPPVDGRYNFLLLGGDSDPTRAAEGMGMRPDTTQVVSIDATTGAATVIGLPRDLHNMPFPEGTPMFDIYPGGYTEEAASMCTEWACLNTVYVDAEVNYPDSFPAQAKKGIPAGVAAMMEAAEGATGLTIQYFVMIDMAGLQELIDSLGGVDINVPERVAMAEPGVPEDQVPEWIEAGPQHLDGAHALMFARSRWSGLGDYDRMMRQQMLQEALLTAMSPANILTKFQEIAAAGTHVIQTNVPQSMLGYFVDLGMKTRKLPMGKMELTPNYAPYPVDPQAPDYAGIHDYIHSVLYPPSPTPTPES